jgi:hypothetical protein
MQTHEAIDCCSKLFINWFTREKTNEDMSKHDDEIADLFTSQIILKKFKAFDIDIVLPDELLLMLYICTEGNPGQFQILLKDLLNSIVKNHGCAISKGYIITSTDFAYAFPMHFPVMSMPEVNAKYEALWDGQKRERKNPMESDNKCDTIEWWKEVMA